MCTGTVVRHGRLICILNLYLGVVFSMKIRGKFGECSDSVALLFWVSLNRSVLTLRSVLPSARKVIDSQEAGSPWLFPRYLTVSISNYTFTHVNTEFLIQSQAELQIMKAKFFLVV